MPHPFHAVALVCFAVPLVAQGQERLTFADTRSGISWQDGLPIVRWAPDQKHVVVQLPAA
jgi:hypothetical protein